MNVTSIVQVILSGVLLGGAYGLVAMGLSLLFGVMRIVNFAHGALLMVAMFASYLAYRYLGLDPYMSMPLVAAVMFILGWCIQSGLIAPVLKRVGAREPTEALILTMGLMIFVESLMLLLFGPNYRNAATPYAYSMITLGEHLMLPVVRVVGWAIAVMVALLFSIFLNRTEIGTAIRATSQDRAAVRLMGVKDWRIYQLVFGLSAATVGIAGAALTPMYPIYPGIHALFTLRAFVVVILGGFGSIWGAFFAGLIVGTLESVSSMFLPATMAEALVFLVFVIVLLVKPSGLLGREAA